MTRQCAITGRTVRAGSKVSHAMNHTRRTFNVNIQTVRLHSNVLGERIRLRLTPNALRSIDAAGGIDDFLISRPMRSLAPPAQLIKRRLLRHQAKVSPSKPQQDTPPPSS